MALINSKQAPVDIGVFNALFPLLMVIGLFGPNPLESFCGLIQLRLILFWFWRKGTNVIMLVLLLIPWLEISLPILESNFRWISVSEMLHGSGRTAYWLAAFGLLATTIGAKVFHDRIDFITWKALKRQAAQLSLTRLILLYFTIGPLTGLLGRLIGSGSSFYQIVTYLNEISVVVLIAICLKEVLAPSNRRVFTVFLVVATVLSFYSFFSEWQIVAFSLALALGIIPERLTNRVAFRFIIFAFAFGNILFLWQAIKPEYRAYLSQSNSLSLSSQAVKTERLESLQKFTELAAKYYSAPTSVEAFEESDLFLNTLRRVGYLEFFALVLNRVPTDMPHEGGSLLAQNLTFSLIPRFLNPNKGVKDDGSKVEKYTGFMVSSHSSFSLGHYVEHYIDFGKGGMLMFLFLYGIIGGFLFYLIWTRLSILQNSLFSIAITYVCLSKWGSFQNDSLVIYGMTFFGVLCHVFLFRPFYIKLVQFVTIEENASPE